MSEIITISHLGQRKAFLNVITMWRKKSVLNYSAISYKEGREMVPHIHTEGKQIVGHTQKSVKPNCESVTESGERYCGGREGRGFSKVKTQES